MRIKRGRKEDEGMRGEEREKYRERQGKREEGEGGREKHIDRERERCMLLLTSLGTPLCTASVIYSQWSHRDSVCSRRLDRCTTCPRRVGVVCT